MRYLAVVIIDTAPNRQAVRGVPILGGWDAGVTDTSATRKRLWVVPFTQIIRASEEDWDEEVLTTREALKAIVTPTAIRYFVSGKGEEVRDFRRRVYAAVNWKVRA